MIVYHQMDMLTLREQLISAQGPDSLRLPWAMLELDGSRQQDGSGSETSIDKRRASRRQTMRRGSATGDGM